MFKILKLFIFLFVLLINNNASAKPVPPGAGDGDEAANILFLVDSSASMGRWIGGDGVGASQGVTYDSQGRILISQGGRRTLGSVIRYTAAGSRDRSFRPIRAIPATGCFQHVDATRNINRQRLRRAATLKFAQGLTTNSITNENIIFISSRERRTINYVFGFNENGTQCRLAIAGPRGGVVHDFDVKTIDGTPYLFMFGGIGGRRGGSFFKSCNLSNMTCRTQQFSDRTHITRVSHRLSVTSAGSIAYFSDPTMNGDLVGFSLASNGGAFDLGTQSRRCTATNSPNLTSQLGFVTEIEVSPDDDNIVYVSSHINHALQKVQWTGNNCSVVTSIGRGLNWISSNSGSANELDADVVGFSGVWGLHVTSTRILTATARGYVDEFDEDLFTVANRNTTWLQQMGGPRIRRWDGVKQAINAIVNDSTLTTGAHFGFGHWNAGESGRGKNSPRGGAFCHRNDGCSYYQGWSGSHPEGRSLQCNSDSCLNVAVSARGAGRIMNVLIPMGMAWGTDARAFSQIAEDYFNDDTAGGSILDPDSECQLNYVIVIGDGAMRNMGPAFDRMARLRAKGVKSLYVAYGGGIVGANLQRFHDLARVGSSEHATQAQCDADDECERAIIADTPEDLKRTLTSKIRQIIADRLAFTAPSITATIQEGGSLYQAQFSYEQFGEWQGTILRKTLKSDGSVDHSMDTPGNWSAAEQVRKQSTAGSDPDSRNLWSALPAAPYLQNWDNFNVDNSDAIRSLFDRLGYTIGDYHNSSSQCSSVGNDTTLGNEVIGLINFMKGNDYFDYDGDCDVEEVRPHVMGDIYHSQLVEVGAPDMNIDFTGDNEEAYHRSINNYQKFMTDYVGRRNILYAGSNSGVLHAINAETGREEWGFIPPFVGALIPQIVNTELDGKIDGDKGGTNPIFGVDGSPVLHDLYIRGYDSRGNLEGDRSWRTILFVPYGRGGAGFSVIDVTYPLPVGGQGPIHMFSVFNDRINSRIMIANVDGDITEYPYNASSTSLINSSEGEVATDNYQDAREEDENRDDGFDTVQDGIATCNSATDFRENGTASCYTSKTWHFPEFDLDFPLGTDIPDGFLSATETINNVQTPIRISSAEMTDDGAGGSLLKVTFDDTKTFNANPSDANSTESNVINIGACLGATGIDPEYDYTKLGETWSTPKIIRMPTSSDGDINSDRYVAVLGSGLAKNNACGGSAIFLVDLEGHEDGKPGRIFGAEINGGPIPIVDTSPAGVALGSEVIPSPNGSDIANAIPAGPIIITPDTAPGVPWRGAYVYVNDLEGKVTKINLSNNTKGIDESGNLADNVTELYDQTTLFRLNASEENGRYSYFSMDAGIGVSDGGFWLFGSTGNYTDLGARQEGLDNILYGVQDKHWPYWKHLNGVTIPKPVSSATLATTTGTTGNVDINPDFIRLAHKGASDATNHVGNAITCINVSGNKDEGQNCPIPDDAAAWVIHLEQNASGNFTMPRTYRKASASPTLFKGQVYFPVYQPPKSTVKCTQGHAFICAADDECGTNTSAKLNLLAPPEVDNPDLNACAFVREGVLSELVIFGDKLFANVAGPSDDESTLFSILSIPGDVITNKGGWRDSSF